MKPQVFIGSSTEGLRIADNLQVLLDYECEVVLWNQGTFEPGGTSLSSLVREARKIDFAVLVVTPDDTIETRGEKRNATRDNVLFELGLFMGALGNERVYMLYDRLHKPDLPSDLAGVTAITYARHTNGNLRASLGAAATQLKEVFRHLGLRQPEVTESELSQPARTRSAPTGGPEEPAGLANSMTVRHPSTSVDEDAIRAVHLTDREVILLPLLATDESLPEIARKLQVSVNTVRQLVTTLRKKFGADTRAELIRRAASYGAIQ